MTTWCSGCAIGNQVLQQNINEFAKHHIRVYELELYNDLGQPGTPIAKFLEQSPGENFKSPYLTLGYASQTLTQFYDPQAYLDIYYLINAKDQLAFTGENLANTISTLVSKFKGSA